MITRPEALALATAQIDDLAPRTNARGYADGTLPASERVTLILQTADWLLAQNEVTDQSVIAAAAREISSRIRGAYGLSERDDETLVLMTLAEAFGDFAALPDGPV